MPKLLPDQYGIYIQQNNINHFESDKVVTYNDKEWEIIQSLDVANGSLDKFFTLFRASGSTNINLMLAVRNILLDLVKMYYRVVEDTSKFDYLLETYRKLEPQAYEFIKSKEFADQISRTEKHNEMIHSIHLTKSMLEDLEYTYQEAKRLDKVN
jgi:hypothetical protein